MPEVDPGYLQTPNPMPEPFLTVEQFAGMWRPLSSTETQAAELLLQAATNWIVEHKPTISPTDPAAQVVCLQVVSEAIAAQKHVGLRQYSRTTGQRMDSGTLAEVGALLTFTAEQRDLLGIEGAAQPQLMVDPPGFEFADSALPSNRYGTRPAGYLW